MFANQNKTPCEWPLQLDRTGTEPALAGGWGSVPARRSPRVHTLQSTFINWADENHGDHDECLARIWTTIRETFYRFSIKNVYYC